jgi:hypothetical protein
MQKCAGGGIDFTNYLVGGNLRTHFVLLITLGTKVIMPPPSLHLHKLTQVRNKLHGVVYPNTAGEIKCCQSFFVLAFGL